MLLLQRKSALSCIGKSSTVSNISMASIHSLGTYANIANYSSNNLGGNNYYNSRDHRNRYFSTTAEKDSIAREKRKKSNLYTKTGKRLEQKSFNCFHCCRNTFIYIYILIYILHIYT